VSQAAAPAPAGSPAARVKPRLRGVSHQIAFYVALVAGGVLVFAADGSRARIAALVYALSLASLFGVSAVYHRVTWKTPGARAWMRRLDHTMIFFLIAGTYTPFALLVLDGTLATVVLLVVWGGALAGTIQQMVWISSPKWLMSVIGIGLGWVAVATTPQMIDRAGVAAVVLIGIGGVLYTAGGVIYALKRPDPAPEVFGYHEIFHLLVIAAAALHFGAVAGYAMPAA
jgi:hemolysin III